MGQPRRITDKQVELFIGMFLRVGVIVAACVVLIGGILFLPHMGGQAPHYSEWNGEPLSLRSIGGVLSAAVALRGDAVIQLGILLLIAVPIARVAVSLVAFLLQRDWLYCVVTFLVLGILLFSLLGGRI
ncbi:MAG: DUF1634 domain-containing protein [Spirochaetia bacterium]